MTSLEFILGAYITTAVIALTIYITRVVVAERKMEHQLEQAKTTMAEVSFLREQLANITRVSHEHESKLSKLTIAKGWTGQ